MKIWLKNFFFFIYFSVLSFYNFLEQTIVRIFEWLQFHHLRISFYSLISSCLDNRVINFNFPDFDKNDKNYKVTIMGQWKADI